MFHCNKINWELHQQSKNQAEKKSDLKSHFQLNLVREVSDDTMSAKKANGCPDANYQVNYWKQYSHTTDSISAKTPKASYEKSGFMLNKISRTSFISDISAISSLIGAHILMSWSIPLVARTESKRHSSWKF